MNATYREPCGCRCDERRYVELCAQHRAEYDATRELWHREHRDQPRQPTQEMAQ